VRLPLVRVGDDLSAPHWAPTSPVIVFWVAIGALPDGTVWPAPLPGLSNARVAAITELSFRRNVWNCAPGMSSGCLSSSMIFAWAEAP